MEFMFLYMKGFLQTGTNMRFNLSVKRNWITISHFATAPFGHTGIWPKVQIVSERWRKEGHLAGLADLCSGKEALEVFFFFFFPCAQKGKVTCMVLGSFKLRHQFSKDIYKEVHHLHDDKWNNGNETLLASFWVCIKMLWVYSLSVTKGWTMPNSKITKSWFITLSVLTYG